MTGKADRTALEWFVEAMRWYAEQHQACPWCHSQHCVIRSCWSQRVEYHCTACDFSTARSEEGEGYVAPGLRPAHR